MNISVKEAASFLNFSEQYVRHLIRDERLPAERIGNTWVLTLDSVLRFLGKSEQVTKIVSDHPRRTDTKTTMNCLSFFLGQWGWISG